MSFSSYLTQQSQQEQIQLLEATLALLVTYVVAGGDLKPEARTQLLRFAEHVTKAQAKP